MEFLNLSKTTIIIYKLSPVEHESKFYTQYLCGSRLLLSIAFI